MDKAKKAKLLELRQKKLNAKKQADQQKHEDIVVAINRLNDILEGERQDNASIKELISKLESFGSLQDEIAKVKQAVENIPKTNNVTIDNLDEIITQQPAIDFSEVTGAINELAEQAAKSKIPDSISINNKKPEAFIPFRRVIEVNGKLAFDNTPTPIALGGGGGASIVNVPTSTGFEDHANITTDLSTPNVIIETDGKRTKTTTINGTTITEVWS